MPTNKGGLNRLENKTHRTFMCTSHRIAVIVIRFTALLYGFNVPVKGLLSLTVHLNSISFIMVMNNDKWYDDDNNNNNSQMWVNLNLRTYKKTTYRIRLVAVMSADLDAPRRSWRPCGGESLDAAASYIHWTSGIPSEWAVSSVSGHLLIFGDKRASSFDAEPLHWPAAPAK